MRCWSSLVEAFSHSSRSAFSRGTSGQPNQLSGPPLMAIWAGTNTLFRLVRLLTNAFRPPLCGSSLLARRWTTVPPAGASGLDEVGQ
jgi:hypothetical protein